MTKAQKTAAKFNLTLGKMTYSDTRRIINHESMPYYVSKDGVVLKQFSSASDLAEWLDGYEITHEQRMHPVPRPME